LPKSVLLVRATLFAGVAYTIGQFTYQTRDHKGGVIGGLAVFVKALSDF